MGCDCKGYLRGWVKPTDVEKALRYLGYKNVSEDTKSEKSWLLKEFHDKYPEEPYTMNPSYPKSDYHEVVSGFIRFDDCFDKTSEHRMFHYFYANECDFSMLQDLPENWDKEDKKDFDIQELTCLSLGLWGRSTDIMKSVIKVLGGGYLDENDCDDRSSYLITPECDVRRLSNGFA